MSTTDQPACTKLQRGQIIPVFTLPGPDGMPHSPWDYKQREHLVLLLIHGTTTDEERNLLLIFAQHYHAFREEDCAILAITANPVITNLQAQEMLHLPFPLLANPGGEVIARYTHWDSETRTLTPTIVLADRYGSFYNQWNLEPEALPIEDLLETLQYLNRLCTP